MNKCPNCEYHKESARIWRQEAYKLSGHPLNDEQEPVAYKYTDKHNPLVFYFTERKGKDVTQNPDVIETALYTAPPRKEWVGLTNDDWEQLWQDIEDACDEGEVAYQEEAQKKHGEGHYYISSEDQWEYDKRTIRDLVEAKLKEKNGDARSKSQSEG